MELCVFQRDGQAEVEQRVFRFSKRKSDSQGQKWILGESPAIVSDIRTEKLSGGILRIFRRNDEKSNLNFPQEEWASVLLWRRQRVSLVED